MAKEAEDASGPVRLSVNLSHEAAEFIREMAAKRGITVTEAIRRALATQKYVEEAIDDGARILIERSGEPTKELIFVI